MAQHQEEVQQQLGGQHPKVAKHGAGQAPLWRSIAMPVRSQDGWKWLHIAKHLWLTEGGSATS